MTEVQVSFTLEEAKAILAQPVMADDHTALAGYAEQKIADGIREAEASEQLERKVAEMIRGYGESADGARKTARAAIAAVREHDNGDAG